MYLLEWVQFISTLGSLYKQSKFQIFNFRRFLSSDEFSVKSEETNAVIVITNESQWGEAATRIYHAEAFKGVV